LDRTIALDIGDSRKLFANETGEAERLARRQRLLVEEAKLRAAECRQLVLLATTGREKTLLTSMAHSWMAIASATARYAELLEQKPPPAGRNAG
jgi:hypothetical protein